jgi:hypothetical protein
MREHVSVAPGDRNSGPAGDLRERERRPDAGGRGHQEKSPGLAEPELRRTRGERVPGPARMIPPRPGYGCAAGRGRWPRQREGLRNESSPGTSQNGRASQPGPDDRLCHRRRLTSEAGAPHLGRCNAAAGVTPEYSGPPSARQEPYRLRTVRPGIRRRRQRKTATEAGHGPAGLRYSPAGRSGSVRERLWAGCWGCCSAALRLRHNCPSYLCRRSRDQCPPEQ